MQFNWLCLIREVLNSIRIAVNACKHYAQLRIFLVPLGVPVNHHCGINSLIIITFSKDNQR